MIFIEGSDISNDRRLPGLEAVFLPHDAMHERGLCRRAVAGWVSVYHFRVLCRNG